MPGDSLARAPRYVDERQQSLREFLTDPAIALGTNHLERGLRVIPMGGKSWMFCWTELDAKYVDIIQSLSVACRLQGINPAIYLTDVLQRVSSWPADRMIELTPRLWKEAFSDSPLISDLDRIGQDGLILPLTLKHIKTSHLMVCRWAPCMWFRSAGTAIA